MKLASDRPSWSTAARRGEGAVSGPGPRGSAVVDLRARIVRATWIVALVAFAIQATGHLVDVLAFDDRYHQLDADAGRSAISSIFSWAGSAAMFVCAAQALLIGLVDPRRRVRFVVLALVVAFLSYDDLSELHSSVGDRVASLAGLHDSAGRFLWPLVYIPLLAVAAWLFLTAIRSATEREARLVRRGLLLLLVAIVLEALSLALKKAGHHHATDPVYATEVVLEEGGELAGWIVLAGALTTEFVSVVVDSVREPEL